MLWHLDTTICAIASGAAAAPRGIIRVSGPESVSLCESLVDGGKAPDGSGPLQSVRRAMRVPTRVRLPGFAASLDVAMHVWPDGRSYTGQPSVELHTVGSPIVLQLLIERLIAAGCRAAAPGEFTYRAFLNGRLDLTQAEAVLGVIHARNESNLRISLRQLAGGLAEPIGELRTVLINLLADLEAGLDFVDEDIQFVDRTTVLRTLDEVQLRLASMRLQLGSRRLLQYLPRVVLAGLPNAGKSSLINALCPSARAIVSEEAGTTRDFLRGELPLGTHTVEVVDTAGFEAAATQGGDAARESPVGRAAQVARQLLWDQADLLLCCGDAQQIGSAQWRELLDTVLASAPNPGRAIWLVATKADVAPRPAASARDTIFDHVVSTSVRSTPGVDALKAAISTWAADAIGFDGDVVPMTLVRCASSIEAADEAVAAASAIARGEPRAEDSAAPSDAGGDELIAAELRRALHELGVVAGEVYTDDILDALFSRFCIGK